MELFSISCATCNRTLKVRDLAAIGKILACPKCGGMVMVEPPPGWVAPPQAEKKENRWRGQEGSPPPRALSSSDSSIDHSEPELDKKPSQDKPKPNKKSDSAAANADTASGSFEGDSEMLSESSAQPSSARWAEESTEMGTDAASQEVVLPTDQWISSGAAQKRRILMICSLVVVGLIVITGGIGLIAGSFVSPTKSTAEAPKFSPENSPPLSDSVVKKNLPNEKDPQEKTSTVEEKTNDKEPAIPPDSQAAKKNTTEPEPEKTTPDLPKPPVDSETKKTTEANPLGLKPKMKPASPDTKKPAEASNNLSPSEGPTPLAPPAPQDPDAPPTKQATPPNTSQDAAPQLPRPPPREINIAERLDDPIEAIEFKDFALADFLRLMINMSGVPISLDLDSLSELKVSPDSRISLRLSGVSWGETLAEGLEQLGLNYRIEEDYLLVGRSEEQEIARRVVNYDVADLVAGDAQAMTSLAELVVALVSPESWEAEDDRGKIQVAGNTLIIDQTEDVHFQTLLLLEKIRVARSLKPRSDYDQALFQQTSRQEQAAEKLTTKVSMNFYHPAPLLKIVRQLEKAAGMRIVVDWVELASQGWLPEAETTLTVREAPLSTALDKLLTPMNLAYRAIDTKTLQITTAAAVSELKELEIYSLAPLLSPQQSASQVIESAQQALTQQGLDPQADAVLRYDSTSKALLARLPQPQQIALKKWLDEQASQEEDK